MFMSIIWEKSGDISEFLIPFWEKTKIGCWDTLQENPGAIVKNVQGKTWEKFEIFVKIPKLN